MVPCTQVTVQRISVDQKYWLLSSALTLFPRGSGGRF